MGGAGAARRDNRAVTGRAAPPGAGGTAAGGWCARAGGAARRVGGPVSPAAACEAEAVAVTTRMTSAGASCGPTHSASGEELVLLGGGRSAIGEEGKRGLDGRERLRADTARR
jgi:hypothetical protein